MFFFFHVERFIFHYTILLFSYYFILYYITSYHFLFSCIFYGSRIKGSSRQTVIFRIETEGGEHTGIQKKIEKEERNTRTNIQSNNISQIPKNDNIDGVIPMTVKVSDENIMEFEEDTSQSTDLFETSSELNGIDKNYSDSHTDSEEDSFRQMIVLFDNSYSWYRAKELK